MCVCVCASIDYTDLNIDIQHRSPEALHCCSLDVAPLGQLNIKMFVRLRLPRKETMRYN